MAINSKTERRRLAQSSSSPLVWSGPIWGLLSPRNRHGCNKNSGASGTKIPGSGVIYMNGVNTLLRSISLVSTNHLLGCEGYPRTNHLPSRVQKEKPHLGSGNTLHNEEGSWRVWTRREGRDMKGYQEDLRRHGCQRRMLAGKKTGEDRAAQYPISVVYWTVINHSFSSLWTLVATVAALCWWCLGKLKWKGDVGCASITLDREEKTHSRKLELEETMTTYSPQELPTTCRKDSRQYQKMIKGYQEKARLLGKSWGANAQVAKVCIEGMYFNIIKATCDKSIANFILNVEELKAWARLGNKTRVPTLATFIDHSIISPIQRN